jgi:hypothetical protein
MRAATEVAGLMAPAHIGTRRWCNDCLIAVWLWTALMKNFSWEEPVNVS